MTESFKEILNIGLGRKYIYSNKDEILKNYILSQANYEFEVLESEAPDSNNASINEERIAKESYENSENEYSKYDANGKNVKFNTIFCSRGRKKYNKNDKSHGKLEKDNILRKIQVEFLSFAINFANEIVIKKYQIKGQFFDLSYHFKQNITKNRIEYLKSLIFGEVLCNKISEKFKNHPSNENKIFYDRVIKNESIQKIFSENYMKIFNIFWKSQRNIKIGDLNYQISPNLKMFDDFLLKMEKKYKNDSFYIQKIKKVIEDY